MRILFVHNALTTFVKIDRDLLSTHFEIEELYLSSMKDINPIKIWQKVRDNDLVFGWFSSWHSFLPIHFASALNRPSILVTGGYDTANLPETNYGNQRFFLSRWITNMTIRRASHLICNSGFTKSEVLNVIDNYSVQISVIYHGLPDTGSFSDTKQDIALNVGNVSNANLLRKGIKPFLGTAGLVSHYQFIQVGKAQDDSLSKVVEKLAPNVTIKGYVSHEDLDRLYQNSRVYIQPSLHEGFGMSVVEAMLAGCIPIVSKEGALPEVVREYGVLLDDISPNSIKEAIRVAEENFPYTPGQIRNFARRNYSLQQRENALLEVIRQLTEQRGGSS